jgi:hypothetical protein
VLDQQADAAQAHERERADRRDVHDHHRPEAEHADAVHGDDRRPMIKG